MKQEEKKYIVEQRASGMSFVQIGKNLGRSEDAVRVAFNRLMAEDGKTTQPAGKHPAECSGFSACKYCGAQFCKNGGSSRRLFCSDGCRNAWCNERKRHIPYSRVCEHCGHAFVAFGNPHKRFCSRKCYADSRKGERDAGIPEETPRMESLAADRRRQEQAAGYEEGRPPVRDPIGEKKGIPEVWRFGGDSAGVPYGRF